MQKLSKAQIKERDDLSAKLSEAGDVLNAAITKYNEAIKAAYEDVEKAMSEFNTAVIEARDFVEQVHSDIENYYDDKSEKWQESERGQNYSSWRDAWSEAISELNEVEYSEPDSFDEADIPDEVIDCLPTECEPG